MNCTHCTPKVRCLSHTQIPFDGTVWMDTSEPEFRTLQPFIIRTKNGAVRDPHGRYLVSLKGRTFDEVPLRYLDWLSGQKWVYGPFRRRLTLYLTKPCIKRELEALFPDPEDDSNTPAFMVQHQYTNREPMPKEDTEPWNWIPEKMTRTRAWQIIVDLLILTESLPQLVEVPILDFHEIHEACKLVPPSVASQARQAFRDWQSKLEALAARHLLQEELADRFNALWNHKLKRAPINARARVKRIRSKYITPKLTPAS